MFLTKVLRNKSLEKKREGILILNSAFFFNCNTEVGYGSITE